MKQNRIVYPPWNCVQKASHCSKTDVQPGSTEIFLQNLLGIFLGKSTFKMKIHVDAHGLKILGRRYLMFFAKIPRGGQGFQEKLPGGVPLFRVLLHFFNKYFEICLRGVLYLPSPDMIGEEIHKNVDSFHKS